MTEPTVAAIVACAMPEEFTPLEAKLTDVEELEGSGISFQRFLLGTLGTRRVLLVQSGIGLTNATIAATTALSLVRPVLYLLAGTTGGIGVDVEVGQIIAGISARYFDADATAFDYQRGQIPHMPPAYFSEEATVSQVLAARTPAWKVGEILSGNSFVTAETAAKVREEFPAGLAVDMETAAAAQTCFAHGVDWLSLRAVSDLCGPSAGQEFHIGAEQAASISADAIEALLTTVEQPHR